MSDIQWNYKNIADSLEMRTYAEDITHEHTDNRTTIEINKGSTRVRYIFTYEDEILAVYDDTN